MVCSQCSGEGVWGGGAFLEKKDDGKIIVVEKMFGCKACNGWGEVNSVARWLWWKWKSSKLCLILKDEWNTLGLMDPYLVILTLVCLVIGSGLFVWWYILTFGG